jgi:hypothetical protein
MTYMPRRDQRFEYATNAIEHIEEHNCSKGCAVPKLKDVLEFGPGGACHLLAMIVAEIEVQEMDDDGVTITCRARIPGTT